MRLELSWNLQCGVNLGLSQLTLGSTSLDQKQMEPYLLKLSPLQVAVFWGRGGGEVSNNVKAFLLTVMDRFPEGIPRKGKVLFPKNEYLIVAISGTKTGRHERYLGSVSIPGCPDISQHNLPFHISTLRNHIYCFSWFTAFVKQGWLLVLISPQISPHIGECLLHLCSR